MDIEFTFPGGKRVDAQADGFLLHTDQPRERGGEGSAPEPFTLFLASLGTCAGLYVLGFCQTRNIRTDQPATLGGEGSAPSPFDLFLASLATCAGYYVLAFCQARGLSTLGLQLRQRTEHDPATRALTGVSLEIELPPGFPAEYREAVVRAAAACKVKKTLFDPPAFEVTTALVDVDAGLASVSSAPRSAAAAG